MSAFELRGVPGKATVNVTASTDGVTLHEGKVRRPELTLAAWRKQLGGDEGYLYHPATGDKVLVSLKPWANADPKNTYISIEFRFYPQRPVANEHLHLFPAGVNDVKK